MLCKQNNFFTESVSYFFSNLYTANNISVSNEIWTELMYRQVPVINQFECSILCYFEVGSKCKIYGFQPPICYLGNPTLNNTATANFKIVTIFSYGKYSWFDKYFKLVHLQEDKVFTFGYLISNYRSFCTNFKIIFIQFRIKVDLCILLVTLCIW